MSGLYVHIPFCHSKCAYCDFFSTPVCKDENRVVGSLIKDYKMHQTEVPGDVTTIYLGGGTPSILSDDNIKRLVSSLPTAGVEEFTIEVNPEDVTDEKVALWRQAGINRVSMGIQSLNDSELRLIGRRHTAADVIAAVETLRRGGIDNISLDLIYGLPTQTLQSWQASLDGVLALKPQHVSAYMLSYEPHTRLTAMLNSGKIKATDEDTIVEMYKVLTETMHEHGFEHYEISNFALPGYRAKHNSSYWDGTPYIGIGPSAHSFDGKHRRINPANIKQYCEKIEAGSTAYEIEQETRADRFNDTLITGMRTAEGLDFSRVAVLRRRQLMVDAWEYIKSGDIVAENGHLRIPEDRWLVSDSIMRDLIQE